MKIASSPCKCSSIRNFSKRTGHSKNCTELDSAVQPTDNSVLDEHKDLSVTKNSSTVPTEFTSRQFSTYNETASTPTLNDSVQLENSSGFHILSSPLQDASSKDSLNYPTYTYESLAFENSDLSTTSNEAMKVQQENDLGLSENHTAQTESDFNRTCPSDLERSTGYSIPPGKQTVTPVTKTNAQCVSMKDEDLEKPERNQMLSSQEQPLSLSFHTFIVIDDPFIAGCNNAEITRCEERVETKEKMNHDENTPNDYAQNAPDQGNNQELKFTSNLLTNNTIQNGRAAVMSVENASFAASEDLGDRHRKTRKRYSRNRKDKWNNCERRFRNRLYISSLNREKLVTILCICIVITFVIFWSPLIGYRFSYVLGRLKSIVWYRRTSFLFALANSLINPFMYFLIRKDFRGLFKQLFTS